jgi:hypothetical protein
LLESIKDGVSSRETSWFSPFQVEVEPRRERKTYAGKTYNSKENIAEFIRTRRSGEKATSRRSAHAGLPAPPADPGGPDDFPPGTRVQHAQFGSGVVLQSIKEGGEMKITVHFTDFGKKKLIQRYSNLVKI